MEGADGPVETIILSSEPATPQLTPAEADCVARIRARRQRIAVSRGRHESPKGDPQIDQAVLPLRFSRGQASGAAFGAAQRSAGATLEYHHHWWVALVVALLTGAVALLYLHVA